MKTVMKLFFKSIFLTLIIASTTTYSAKAETPESTPKTTPQAAPAATNLTTVTNSEAEVELRINNLLRFARQFRGVPYRYGGTSPRGFDCSGFTSYVYKNMGYSIPRTGRAQFANGKRVERSQLKPGDLVFFAGRGGGAAIGHVGIVTAVDGNGSDFSFIHASCSRGITESHSTESYYRSRYRNACRVIMPDPAAVQAEQMLAESDQLLNSKVGQPQQAEKSQETKSENL